jgi:hypothetical protein
VFEWFKGTVNLGRACFFQNLFRNVNRNRFVECLCDYIRFLSCHLWNWNGWIAIATTVVSGWLRRSENPIIVSWVVKKCENPGVEKDMANAMNGYYDFPVFVQ